MNDDYAQLYGDLEERHWWWTSRRKIVVSTVRSLVPSNASSPRAMLEIGCGTGRNLLPFLKDYACSAIEPDDLLRARACDVTGLDVEYGLLPDGLPLGQRTFDVIMLLDVLEHVEDDVASLATIYQHLRPGGWMIINVPALMWLWSVHDTMNFHKRRYHYGDLRQKLIAAGFEINRLHYWGKTLVLPAAAARKLKRHDDLEAGKKLVGIPPGPINAAASLFSVMEYHCLSWWARLPGLSLFAAVQKPL